MLESSFDDLFSFNNKRFKELISGIYSKELTVSETTECTLVASYLDLLFTRDKSKKITTKLHNKRDAFGLHIVNFPFMSSNIPSAPAYGVYASQLIRYAICCSNYSDFLLRHMALVTRLLSLGYKVNCLSNTFKGELQRENKLISYERAFKMLKNDRYIAGIDQAVLELLSFKVESGNHQRRISLLHKFSDVFGNMRLVPLKMTSHLTSHNFQILKIEIFSKLCKI